MIERLRTVRAILLTVARELCLKVALETVAGDGLGGDLSVVRLPGMAFNDARGRLGGVGNGPRFGVVSRALARPPTSFLGLRIFIRAGDFDVSDVGATHAG